MRRSSFRFAVLAGLLVVAGAWWALRTEARLDRSDVARADGWRYNTLVPSDHGALSDCVVCHRVDRYGPERSAPSLWGIVGAPMHRSAWFGYSQALAAREGVWDAQTIDAYLADPVGYLPGTKKTLPAIRDPEQRQRIIAALEKLSNHD